MQEKFSKVSQISALLLESLKSCSLCPRDCEVNRLKNEKGFCKTGRYAIVSSAFPHFGEEPPLVGSNGSGTIFFSWCNLGCIYCQNYSISHLGEGEEFKKERIAGLMLNLQKQGCHNINLVTPTHVIPQIMEALVIALENGLDIPIVYNSGGYDRLETLKLLDGIIDIYLPDAKYSETDKAKKYSTAPDYWEINQAALLEMHRQVGDLKLNSRGIAAKGLIIRHLILPNKIAGSFEILRFIRQNLSNKSCVNIMDQYHPCYTGGEFPELSRRITFEEYNEVINYARSLGLSVL